MRALLLLFLVCLGAPLCEAQTSRADEEIEVDIQGVKIKIPDVVLRNQDGQNVRFYSDLIKDKIVVLDFFYASCAYICARQGKVFSELQSLLGERLGKSVFLISVSID